MTLAPREVVGAPARQWRSYPEYKYAGVEWLGEIPAHWETSSIKRFADRVQTGSTPPTAQVHYYEDGTVPWFGPGSFSTDLLLDKPVKLISNDAVHDGVARVFQAGSTMIVTIGATIGKVGYIETPASSNQQITGVTFDVGRVAPKFAAYQVKRLEPVLKGIAPNTTLPILDQHEVGNLPFCCPPFSEQQAIAAFLDRETAKIDKLIAKRERLIELLEEKRIALISRAVTKGLDPEVPMKYSGVHWLGGIPAHWEIKRLKHITTCLDGRRVPLNSEQRSEMQGEYPYWGANSIVDRIDRWLFDEDLVLLGEDGAPFFDPTRAVAFSVSGKIWVNNHAHILRPSQGINSRFLAEALNTVDYRAFIDGSTRDKLTQGDMNHIPIQHPPFPEQLSIAAFLDRETTRLDTLASKARYHIEKLREYRTALISAAVTGKIDVREET